MKEVDRAVVERAEAGFARVLVRRGSDEVLGATIVGPACGRADPGIRPRHETRHRPEGDRVDGLRLSDLCQSRPEDGRKTKQETPHTTGAQNHWLALPTEAPMSSRMACRLLDASPCEAREQSPAARKSFPRSRAQTRAAHRAASTTRMTRLRKYWKWIALALVAAQCWPPTALAASHTMGAQIDGSILVPTNQTITTSGYGALDRR